MSCGITSQHNMNDFLVSSLRNMRDANEMCDIVIVTQNNVQHAAHSVILGAASPVFKVMVTKEFKEFHSKIINLPDVSEEMMEKILHFIYSGMVEINNDIVVDLFSLADRLELSVLVNTCKEFINAQMDIHNCLGVRRLGERYCHGDIVTSSTLFMLHMFQEFSTTDDFLQLSLLELIQLLTHDELNVDREDYLFDIIFLWVDHDAKRKKHMKELLKCIRYSIMSTKIIKSAFASDCHLRSRSLQKLGKNILNGCTSYENKLKSSSEESLDWLLKAHRIPPQIILLIGGWNRGRTLDICECYNRKSNQWYVTDHLRDPAGGRCYYGMEYFNKFVYVVGGYDGKHYLNSVRKFDPVKREWSDIANMHIRRCFNAVVLFKDELYAIAGFDGNRRLTSVEKYSPTANQWTLLRPLATPRSDASAVVHAGKIYVFGGYGGESLCSCEVYDEETASWQNINQMNCKRSGASAVSLPDQNRILILGGYNGTSRVKSIEYYDPETDTWTFGPAMQHSRSNFATCIYGQFLFVIGGYTGHATIPEVEIYNFYNRTWSSASPLNSGRSAMKAVILNNIPNIKDYFAGGTQSLDRGTENPDFWARRLTDEG